MWWKILLILFYLSILFIFSRILEAMAYYQGDYLVAKLIDPFSLSIRKLKEILDQRGVNHGGILEKKELTDLVKNSGEIITEEELKSLSDDYQKLISDDVHPTNFTCSSHFYEKVEDTKDSVWLVQVLAQDSLPFIQGDWNFLVNRFARFGVRTGIFHCSLDDSLCKKKNWLRSQLVLAMPEGYSSKDKVTLQSYTGASLTPRSILHWVNTNLARRIRKIDNMDTFQRDWLNFDPENKTNNMNSDKYKSSSSQQKERVRIVYASRLKIPPMFFSVMSVRFSGRVKFGLINLSHTRVNQRDSGDGLSHTGVNYNNGDGLSHTGVNYHNSRDGLSHTGVNHDDSGDGLSHTGVNHNSGNGLSHIGVNHNSSDGLSHTGVNYNNGDGLSHTGVNYNNGDGLYNNGANNINGYGISEILCKNNDKNDIGGKSRDFYSANLCGESIKNSSYIIITPEKIVFWKTNLGELSHYRQMILLLKSLHPEVNDIFIISFILLNLLCSLELFVSLPGLQPVKRLARALWLTMKCNIISILIWVSVLGLFRFSFSEFISSGLLTLLRTISFSDFGKRVRSDYLSLTTDDSTFVIPIVAFLLVAYTFYRIRVYFCSDVDLISEDYESSDELSGTFWTFNWESYLSNLLQSLRTNSRGYAGYRNASSEEIDMERFIERLAVPNLWLRPLVSPQYIHNLPIWKHRSEIVFDSSDISSGNELSSCDTIRDKKLNFLKNSSSLKDKSNKANVCLLGRKKNYSISCEKCKFLKNVVNKSLQELENEIIENETACAKFLMDGNYKCCCGHTDILSNTLSSNNLTSNDLNNNAPRSSNDPHCSNSNKLCSNNKGNNSSTDKVANTTVNNIEIKESMFARRKKGVQNLANRIKKSFSKYKSKKSSSSDAYHSHNNNDNAQQVAETTTSTLNPNKNQKLFNLNKTSKQLKENSPVKPKLKNSDSNITKPAAVGKPNSNYLNDSEYQPPSGIIPSTECSICLESYKNDNVLCGLPCGHIFHQSCIMGWLTRDNHCCPVCRWPAYEAKPCPAHLHLE